ncbi:unnamed protein product [Microthlaspi erraticum]|uniref:Uncharacterized protein n=1 Tax=Microthlaspi erraticum TaxID=1685480 RepID=A0A6D2JWM7_9BRAS|nr:unnamed protein product [Microthlaspi erraticum]
MKFGWNPLKPKTPQPGPTKVPQTPPGPGSVKPMKPPGTVKQQELPDDPPESFKWLPSQDTPVPDAGKLPPGAPGTGKPPPGAPVTESTEKRSPLKAALDFFSKII